MVEVESTLTDGDGRAPQGDLSPLDVIVHRQLGLTVGALLHLEGGPPHLDELRAHVAGRVKMLPALSAVVTGEGVELRWTRREPCLDDHIRERQLPAGGSVEEVTRELSQAPFPVSGPRWDLTVLHGHIPSHYAILFRAHHGLQDGCGVAHTLETLFSASAVPRERSSGVARALVEPPSPSLRQKVAAARLLVRTTAKTDLWPHPIYRYSPDRTLQWAAVCTDTLRSAARRYDGTVNDAYVASVARTFARWAAVHAMHTSRRTLPLTVAMNIRRPADVDAPGNQTLGGRLILPGADVSASRNLAATVAATAVLKSAAHREVLRRFAQGAPKRLISESMRLFLAPERGSIFCSHVMFRHPLSWRGAPVLAVDPLVLLPQGAPAAVLLYTYQGRSSALFVTDPVLPEMNTLHSVWQHETQHWTAQ